MLHVNLHTYIYSYTYSANPTHTCTHMMNCDIASAELSSGHSIIYVRLDFRPLSWSNKTVEHTHSALELFYIFKKEKSIFVIIHIDKDSAVG